MAVKPDSGAFGIGVYDADGNALGSVLCNETGQPVSVSLRNWNRTVGVLDVDVLQEAKEQTMLLTDIRDCLTAIMLR